MIRFAILLLPALLLSACGGGKTDERDTAAGEILPGSASDAMLQTDRLQSEAPLVAPKVADGDEAPGEKAAAAPKADEPDETESPDAASAAAPVAAAPAPAETPAP